MAYLKDCYGDFDLNIDPANTVGLQLTVTDANDGGDDGGTLLDTSAGSPASFSSTDDVIDLDCDTCAEPVQSQVSLNLAATQERCAFIRKGLLSAIGCYHRYSLLSWNKILTLKSQLNLQSISN